MRTVSLALVLAVLGTGCMTVRSEPPHFAGAWPPAETGPRPAVELVISGGATTDSGPRDLGPILERWGAETDRAYRESALFSDVRIGTGRGDVRVEVELHADVRQNGLLTALSSLTLFVLPHVVTTDIVVATRVTTDAGQSLGTIEVRGRSRTWYELLLFPIASFYEPQTVTPGIVYDLNRETIATLHARGVF